MEQNTASPLPERDSSTSLEDLAQSQGVSPVRDIRELLGQPSADDESAEDFAAMLRQWRREGSLVASRS